MNDERLSVNTNETLFLGIDAGFMIVLVFNLVETNIYTFIAPLHVYPSLRR